ncbi:MAG: MFS transporter [Patescibacteria group bacterium]
MIRKIKDLNNYLFITAPETFAAVPRRMLSRGLSTFPAFQDRNYRLYFAGQFISLAGSWLQQVAQGWLVFELTHSAFWVGFVTATSSLPVLFFGVFAGVIVDRFNTKTLLYISQVLPMLFSAVLGVLTLSGMATITNLSVLALLMGFVNALDVPSRQTFTAKMMDRSRLASAIVLNAAAFNGSRIIGPSFAGISIALVGVGGTFLINATSFIAVLVSLWLIRVDARPPDTHAHPVTALKEGIRYTFSRPDLRLIMFTVACVSIFGWSYIAILPVIAGDIFHQDATGLGHMYTAIGFGAVTTTVLISLYLSRWGPARFIIGGNIAITAILVIFSFVTDFSLGLTLMFLAGLSLLAQMSVMNSTVQHSIDGALRGRVMSIYVTMFRGMSPIGALLIGILADFTTPQWAIRLMAIPLAATTVLLLTKRHLLPKRWEHTPVVKKPLASAR